MKSTKVEACQYGLDGKLQKAPVVEPPPPEEKRGLKGRIIAKKTEEMKDELESAAALAQQYVPPDPGMMQVVVNAGTASIAQAGPQALKLTFPGYVKAGDALSLTFEKAIKTLRQIDVSTWLDDQQNTVTLRVTMLALPDGDELPGADHAEHSEEQDRSPGHEDQLPEARPVATQQSSVDGRTERVDVLGRNSETRHHTGGIDGSRGNGKRGGSVGGNGGVGDGAVQGSGLRVRRLHAL